jgi:PAS domain S-box-containing protein
MTHNEIKVLLIEDNLGDARLIQEMLRQADDSTFTIEHEDRLSKGLDRLAGGDIELILLDFGLPDSSGLETFFKVYAGAPDVPVVILTSLDDTALAVSAVQEGAQDYLCKNRLDSELLARSMRYAIERKKVEKQIKHLNSVLKAIRNVNQLIVMEKERDRLLQKASDLLTEARGYDAVWLGFMGDDKCFSNVVGSGFSEDVPRFCQYLMAGNHPQCIETVFDHKDSFAVVDESRGCGGCVFKNVCFGKDVAIIRVEHGVRFFGLFVVLLARDVAVDEAEKDLLIEVAGDIGLALYNMDLEEAQRKRERTVERQNRMLMELAGSKKIYQGDLSDSLKIIAEAAARAFEVQQVSVWVFTKDGAIIRCIDLYDMSADTHSQGMEIRAAEHPFYFKTLAEDDLVAVDDARNDPRTREFVDSCLSLPGITSMMDVPVTQKGERIGIICYEHVGPARKWTLEEQNFARIPANYLSLAIEAYDRKKAEDALAAESERLAVTLRSIGEGVIATDREGKIALINKAGERLTGWMQEEAIRKPLEEVLPVISEETRVPRNPVEKIIETMDIADLVDDTLLIARDGREIAIACNGAPIFDMESKIVGVILVFQDVTERRKAEQELLKAQKLESVGLLAGGIAHDFNNILTGILGNVTLAKIDPASEGEMFKRLEEAEKACLRAKALTRQLLTFSKGGELVKKTISASQLIEEATAFAMSGSNVKCENLISHDLCPVEADEDQTNQVISNLLINADQAMPEGGTVEVHAENVIVEANDPPSLTAGKYVKISIKDQGVGIPEQHLSRIFDPYFTTKQKGNGLGLASVYSIIKKHGGDIGVESEAGVGSTFTFYLPAAEGKIETAKKEITELVRGEGKILLMDDEEMVLKVVGQMLSRLGYEAEFSRDGDEAVKLYRKAKESGDPFAAVIMDLTIPGGIGGKEAIGKVLEIDPNVKAIVSSGYSIDPIMADYRKHGFSGVIVKPVQMKELSDTLQNVIGGRN